LELSFIRFSFRIAYATNKRTLSTKKVEITMKRLLVTDDLGRDAHRAAEIIVLVGPTPLGSDDDRFVSVTSARAAAAYVRAAGSVQLRVGLADPLVFFRALVDQPAATARLAA
jgi:hypothetical protein